MRYPAWFCYPQCDAPPSWVHDFVHVVEMARGDIECKATKDLTSDRVLGYLRPGLVALGYEVEAGEAKADGIRRPSLVMRGVPRVCHTRWMPFTTSWEYSSRLRHDVAHAETQLSGSRSLVPDRRSPLPRAGCHAGVPPPERT